MAVAEVKRPGRAAAIPAEATTAELPPSRGPPSPLQLAENLQAGAIGNDDQPVGDTHPALALPGAQMLVHALSRRADYIGELALGEVDAVAGTAVGRAALRDRRAARPT